MAIQVGEVIAVHGVKIILKIFDESSKDTIFYDGNKFKGVSIREHITIQRGFKDIVCIIEGEYLDESRYEKDSNKVIYIRKVEAKPLGYFHEGRFVEGIKFLPMIKDPVFLISETQVAKIYHGDRLVNSLVIGNLLKENIPLSLPWSKLFNTHIGIFGNTGSGKSNTLAKLYKTLFDLKKDSIKGVSKFILLDFNGEYTADQLLDNQDKKVYLLSTREESPNKFPIGFEELLDSETLGLLFKATPNTQLPFIKRVVKGWKKYIANQESLSNYVKYTFQQIFMCKSQKKEAIDLMRQVLKIIRRNELDQRIRQISWHNKNLQFFEAPDTYFDGTEEPYNKVFKALVDEITIDSLTFFEELLVRFHLQLINDLNAGYVQFDHIQPLLKRIESSVANLQRVIEINGEFSDEKILTIVSLRKCNQEIKKILPLLLAKHLYEKHKQEITTPPDKTLHLIIDEAHNILSLQSMREQESWKDYRLELFEEIIKEGRKFGVFLTLSSQRPADISPTIMSQIHNFFIHRLVNDKDLFLLDNTISTLDSLSKGMIPNLSKGCCIITGTSFDLPLVLQVHKLERRHQPDSEDVDLDAIWS
ncbi:ATP-binding protein [Legionella jordanis]|uniref:AAA-like domain protein n=1 Tax=Legionella jordanis TaxID=456 RepID=A0A0W0V9Y8_9GAMM|nr:ATP-binding protein [Legionella jordanis]KTD16906.1 AAA-like domain protein [Legionella jordanis]RMX00314.1 ATP-binding protein [Legionella jordanis]VEH13604.1 Type IV secretory pathway, VirB4 components [Legionella jordanis]